MYSSLALLYFFLMETADSPAFCHSSLFFSTLMDSLFIDRDSSFYMKLWLITVSPTVYCRPRPPDHRFLRRGATPYLPLPATCSTSTPSFWRRAAASRSDRRCRLRQRFTFPISAHILPGSCGPHARAGAVWRRSLQSHPWRRPCAGTPRTECWRVPDAASAARTHCTWEGARQRTLRCRVAAKFKYA